MSTYIESPNIECGCPPLWTITRQGVFVFGCEMYFHPQNGL